ncbi:MAG: hypothetical protein QGH33_02295, partial [Pirellulaceae bacterium]|nr:hypothetical protein [Pirellulaceae bacterium]
MNPNRSLFGPAELVCLALFLVAGLFITLHHELWRDEMQHWAIGVASESPADVLNRVEYENSPALWNFILYGITRVTRNPVAMQIVHVLLATIGAAIFLRWAPFSRVQKVLFLFGYFSAYEYCVISRHYVLECLFLFIFLAGIPWRGKKGFIAAFALFFLTQTSLFGLFMAFAAVVAWLARHFWPPAGVDRVPTRQLVLPMAIVVAGGFWSYTQITPPDDSALHPSWDWLNKWWALRAGTVVWRVFMPFPALQVDFWNTNILDTFRVLHDATDLPSLFAQCTLTAAILLGSFMLFRKRPEALAMFFIVTGLCMILFFFKKLGYIRHHGHVYLAWVAALWLLWMAQPATQGEGDRRPMFSFNRLSPWVTCLFAIHVGAAAYAAVIDYIYPFSQAGETAKWIRSVGRQDDIVMAPAVIASHLERDVFMYEQGTFGSYRVWKLPYPQHNPKKLISDAEQFYRTRGKPVLIVTPLAIDEHDVNG